jgi:hypothetical protein
MSDDAMRYASFDELGRLVAEVIITELRKAEGSTTGDMLVCLESLVVNALAAVQIQPAGKEGKLLKQLRENVMRRLAQARVLEGKARGMA